MKKFITWIGGVGGSLGLLTAALGYLALGAFDDAIGIPVLLEDKLHYITIGGLFFARSITFIFASLIDGWQSWLVVLVLGILLAAHLSERYLKPKPAAAVSWTGIAGLILGLLFAVIWLSCSLDQDAFPYSGRKTQYGTMALFVSGLFVLVGIQESWLQAGKTFKIVSRYKWVRIPVLAVAVICAFLLPRAYGIMTLDRIFPEVLELDLQSRTADDSDRFGLSLLLLRNTETRAVFFDPSDQTIISLNAKQLVWMKLGKSRRIMCEEGNR